MPQSERSVHFAQVLMQPVVSTRPPPAAVFDITGPALYILSLIIPPMTLISYISTIDQML